MKGALDAPVFTRFYKPVHNIGSNFFTSSGISDFLRNLPGTSHIKNLYMNQPLEIDAFELAKLFPKNLEEFYLDHRFNSHETIEIIEGLPKGIRIISMNGNITESRHLDRLIQNMPPLLEQLNYIYLDLKNESNSLGRLFRMLPNSLHSIEVGGEISQNQTACESPPGLLEVNISVYFANAKINGTQQTPILNQFASCLPPGLKHLSFSNRSKFPLSKGSLDKLKNISSFFIHNQNDLVVDSSKYISWSTDPNLFINVLNRNPSIFRAYGFKKYKDSPKVSPKYFKDTRLSAFGSFGEGFDDKIADLFVKYNLSHLKGVIISNSSLSNKGLVTILKALPANINYLILTSNKKAFTDIDKIIKNLPPNLESLRVTGMNLGYYQFEKFLKWQQSVYEKTGTKPKFDF